MDANDIQILRRYSLALEENSTPTSLTLADQKFWRHNASKASLSNDFLSVMRKITKAHAARMRGHTSRVECEIAVADIIAKGRDRP